MKKVRIVTFHRAHNYGAILQAYSLINVIKSSGYDVKIIDYINKKIYDQYNLLKPLKKNLFLYLKQLLFDIKNYKKNINRFLNFNNFINNKLLLTNKIYKIKKYNETVDALVAGSDQIWNPNIVGCLSDVYTLNFGAKNINRISYAASIGNSNIDKKYVNDFVKKLNVFDSISVREETGKLELEKIIKSKKIDVVLDPVFLLKKEEWEKETVVQDIKEKYILTYLVEKNIEYRKIIKCISEKTGLKIITFDQNNKEKNILKNCYTSDPIDFISLIKDAEYVITTSFHATAFSLIFNKNFYVVPHKKTGSRVTDLLSKFHLENRIVYSLDEFEDKNIDDNIDYKEVNIIIELEANKSRDWLLKSLEGES